eukprot:TRINITY_DN10749_c0_g2_i1.p1 TRINITY_DN10749_c0_g2~~TRINITY_DN10749_c0_g2_i1.p1  ORF type:complete len:118 (+),score=8.89 TRINITY_DN10749_c0_g2_i1:39-392(+)
MVSGHVSEAASVIQRSLRMWLAMSKRRKLEAIRAAELDEVFRQEDQEYRETCAKVVQQVFAMRRSSQKWLEYIKSKRANRIIECDAETEPDYLTRLYHIDPVVHEGDNLYPACLYSK